MTAAGRPWALRAVGPDDHLVVARPGPTGVVIGQVEREGSHGWYVQPSYAPDLTGWGGYATCEDAADALHRDWLLEGRVCPIAGAHCSSCGSTDGTCSDHGYSSCCNEPVVNSDCCRYPENHQEP